MPDSAAALPVYLDCDTGIGDAMAIAYLLASEHAALLGIGTVSGNTSAAGAARNTLDLLALAGRDDIPVAVGEHDFLTRAFHGGATRVHGDNGIGGVVLPESPRHPVAESAPEMLVRLAHENAGQLRVIAIGPLTNLAIALRLDPTIADLVADVTIMGGAAMVPGNVTPVAEANVHNDPDAAAAVLEAAWPVTLVPLDTTMQSLLDTDDRDRLLASTRPVAHAIGEMLDTYFDFYVQVFGRRVSVLHDPLAAAVALGDLELDSAPIVHVEIDTTNGPGRGQTVSDLRGRFRGHPPTERARTRLVLSVAEPFAPKLMAALLTA
ncbi:nucleoside hydrolase [Lacisediminihabitans changchengi]|uniref:Nucleoside hydrolase n=1 Tax=Lacisediminihabitans changchengi TaxID=2787634 RepID=A0A934SLB1_9MICO|nr:nucleoside hydrolase [Lacisediminihabitans changchengi]MBK4347022.1 nucleoside hydrolase [Lacisediminihabitans changchengi]MBK4347855.1 nucleoside hydrolase [Lacisediminihabitans changchengi]